MPQRVVIVGAGHAGVQLAASLREEGHDGPIDLIDPQTVLPYQRPPLSKAFMKGEATAESLVLRGASFYVENAIALRLGHGVTAIDRQSRTVTLGDGGAIAYDWLALATGARARPLPVPGRDLRGIFELRTVQDAEQIRSALVPGQPVVVVGAGFIGLEFAAVAARLGCPVTVLEAQDRVMGRAVSPIVSEAFKTLQATLGVTLRFGARLERFTGANGSLQGVELADGTRLAATVAVVGIGVLAEDRLAAEAGLSLANGIVVDAGQRTSDPSILAIGDNNQHQNPFQGDVLRLESVQNALDQAKVAARTIVGKATAYDSLPWFWSDQGPAKLQIAGVAPMLDKHVVRGDVTTGAFSVFGFRNGRLAVVESINKPADHMAARKLIGERRSITPDEAADLSFDLRAAALARGGAERS